MYPTGNPDLSNRVIRFEQVAFDKDDVPDSTCFECSDDVVDLEEPCRGPRHGIKGIVGGQPAFHGFRHVLPERGPAFKSVRREGEVDTCVMDATGIFRGVLPVEQCPEADIFRSTNAFRLRFLRIGHRNEDREPRLCKLVHSPELHPVAQDHTLEIEFTNDSGSTQGTEFIGRIDEDGLLSRDHLPK